MLRVEALTCRHCLNQYLEHGFVMNLALTHRLMCAEPLPAADAQVLVATARTLKQADATGTTQPLLKGKNIAVLCDNEPCQAADDFTAAAVALGARVSRLSQDAALLQDSGLGTIPASRMLGRLYDAVECDHLTPDGAARLQREVGVPVYNALARPDHPLQQLMPAPIDAADRKYLVQAALLHTMG